MIEDQRIAETVEKERKKGKEKVAGDLWR